ncbi:hypothetical protein EVAR_73596_1 [Eumeta japonica]|uniref:Uncharacterized protein n=1 Tax=Eumeta variegata TaxID=151549 RepID=A0A4C1SDZ7_EUMVA|nr:hypothetical protein EVAR_73596_1 [Eumeta japonica]
MDSLQTFQLINLFTSDGKICISDAPRWSGTGGGYTDCRHQSGDNASGTDFAPRGTGRVLCICLDDKNQCAVSQDLHPKFCYWTTSFNSHFLCKSFKSIEAVAARALSSETEGTRFNTETRRQPGNLRIDLRAQSLACVTGASVLTSQRSLVTTGSVTDITNMLEDFNEASQEMGLKMNIDKKKIRLNINTVLTTVIVETFLEEFIYMGQIF